MVAAVSATWEMWPGTLLPLGLLILKASALAAGPRPFHFQAHEWAWCAVTTGIWGISTITVVARESARAGGGSATVPTGAIVGTVVAAGAFFVLIAGLETSAYAAHRAIAALAGVMAWVCIVPSIAYRVAEARWSALSLSGG